MKDKYYFNSFFWSTIATLSRAIVNFISIPLLLKYFGIEDYGVLTLAISTNAYIALLDVGGNNGPIKFFSEWKTQNNIAKIERVSRTSISFYGILGAINIIILLIIAIWGQDWFNLTTSQFYQYKVSLIIIAAFSIVNWCTHVFSQLLIAFENIQFLRKIDVSIAVLNLLIVFLTIWFGLTLNEYFLFFTIVQSSIIIPYVIKLKHTHLFHSFLPQLHWHEFGEVLKYCVAIFAMSIFQMLAAKSRPIILALFADNAAISLGEYRIVEVFPTFLISMCGALITIFLPRSAKHMINNDRSAIELMAYEGSKLTSIFSCLLCFPVIINAGEILEEYVGTNYSHLEIWLALWCFSLVLNLYNSPIASLVLADGKTKMLVYSSAIACLISIVINIILCKTYGMGAAVIGYLVYIIIQQLFYFFYFDNKVLLLDSLKVFKSFGMPVLMGSIASVPLCFTLSFFSDLSKVELIILGMCKAFLWCILFISMLSLTKTIRFSDIKSIIKK